MSAIFYSANGEFEITCDSCSYTETYRADDFDEGLQSAKLDGWQVRRTGVRWGNSCPACNPQGGLFE
jgi:hypothetical protein